MRLFLGYTSNPPACGMRTIKVNIDKCGHCGACVAVCPTNSIELVESCLKIGDACTTCATCVSICPVGALTALEEEA
ncbi:MAG: 4Fe-4S dicluster domain-containing protein [Halobacteriota archaeon]